MKPLYYGPLDICDILPSHLFFGVGRHFDIFEDEFFVFFFRGRYYLVDIFGD